MATIERERTTRLLPPRPRPERPVFVAEDDRRARWLRRGAAATAVLACLWVAALAVGILGFRSLPNVSLPGLGGGHNRPGEQQSNAVRPLPSSAAAPARSPKVQARQRPTSIKARVAGTGAPARAPAVASTRRRVSPPAPPAQTQITQPQPLPIPPPSQRAGMRLGWITPPGQTRRAQAPPAPPAPPGQSRRPGNQPETTEATTTTVQVPPGQQQAPGLKD
jgi:hypothetical protein